MECRIEGVALSAVAGKRRRSAAFRLTTSLVCIGIQIEEKILAV